VTQGVTQDEQRYERFSTGLCRTYDDHDYRVYPGHNQLLMDRALGEITMCQYCRWLKELGAEEVAYRLFHSDRRNKLSLYERWESDEEVKFLVLKDELEQEAKPSAC
jgi:hypothetical protein